MTDHVTAQLWLDSVIYKLRNRGDADGVGKRLAAKFDALSGQERSLLLQVMMEGQQ